MSNEFEKLRDYLSLTELDLADEQKRTARLRAERDEARRGLATARSELAEERKRVKSVIERLRKVEKGRDESRDDLATAEQCIDRLNAAITEQIQENTDIRMRLRQVLRLSQMAVEIAGK